MYHPDTLGYQITRHEDSTGHITHQLIVNMSSEPTKEHYDPDELWLHVGDERLDYERLILTHPLIQKEDRRACAGRVGLCDRKGKCVEFFTYGGSFKAHTSRDITNAELSSPAPIIQVTLEGNAQLLVEESEVLLARQRALAGADRARVDARLCQIDPFVLYVSILSELIRELDGISDSHLTANTLEFHNFLHREFRQAQRAPQWTGNVPPLAELFA